MQLPIKKASFTGGFFVFIKDCLIQGLLKALESGASFLRI